MLTSEVERVAEIIAGEKCCLLVVPRTVTVQLNALSVHCSDPAFSRQPSQAIRRRMYYVKYEGWNFNSGNYLFTTDTK